MNAHKCYTTTKGAFSILYLDLNPWNLICYVLKTFYLTFLLTLGRDMKETDIAFTYLQKVSVKINDYYLCGFYKYYSDLNIIHIDTIFYIFSCSKLMLPVKKFICHPGEFNSLVPFSYISFNQFYLTSWWYHLFKVGIVYTCNDEKVINHLI